jgi:glycolate oxidase iron-sulfur subunit
MNKHLAYEETIACVQCGYCLPSCPTYVTLGKERYSPRGRIHLVKMVAEGKLSLDDISDSLELCLGCRACEDVCPTNIKYGKIFESYKVEKTENEQMPFIEKFVMQKVLPNKFWMQILSHSLEWYQKTNMDKLVRKSSILSIFPEQIRTFEGITPSITSPKKKDRDSQVFKSKEKPKARVGFFTGCVMDVFFARVNDLSIKLLQYAGYEVVMIKEQTCCGALQHHSGDKSFAKKLAKQNIAVFEKHDVDYVVNSIGGCGAMLVEYDELLADEPEWVSRAEQFAEKSVDISVLLNKYSLPFVKEIKETVTYQPSCHLRNVQNVKHEPIELLTSIPGIRYLPLSDMEMCCGSAGIYNLVHYDTAMKILDEKMEHVKSVAPDIIVTSNPGCHLQMCLGVKREGLEKKVKVLHLVELLAEACNIHETL